jgi:glycosyltransferase involved in cell wall biosynthesis
MRIGLDAKRAYHNKTGLGNYSRTIIQALFQLYPENKYFLVTPSVTDEFSSGNDAVNLTPSPSGKLMGPLWRTFMLDKILLENQIDIYHGLTNELPFNLDRNIAGIVTIHDLIFLRYPHLYNSWDVAIYKKKVISSCKRADRVIAISSQTKEDLIDILKVPEEKISVIYQDCSTVYHIPPAETQVRDVKEKLQLPDKYILSVGTLEERKNQLLILKALRLLGRDYKLVLLGKPTEYKKKLLDYISASQLENQVTFLQNVDLEDMPSIFALAGVFVYPSIFEGFGIPVLEALNCGIPVITTGGSCLRETGGPAALYIDPEDENDLADKIKTVYGNPAMAEKMIRAGAEHARLFRKESTTAELVSLYSRL